jgi:hypothetical protein
MSLDFDVTRVKNYDVVTTLVIPATETQEEQRKWHPLTEALVWLTVHTGINDITVENWQEFYSRIYLWERAIGPMLSAYSSPEYYNRFITPLEVYMHIGLSTNASRKTKRDFLSTLAELVEREDRGKCERAIIAYQEYNLDSITAKAYQTLWQGSIGYTLDDKIAANPMIVS